MHSAAFYDSMRKLLFVISVSLNVLFVTGACYFVYRKGGIGYLRHRSAILSGQRVGIEDFPLSYQQRYSDFRGHPFAPSAIVLVGDSLTEQGDWEALFPGTKIVNRGIGADTTVGVRFRLPDLTRPCPAKIFFLIGIADLRIGRSVDRILEEYTKILDGFRGICPTAAVYVESLLPINHAMFGPEIANDDITATNRGLSKLARERGATFLDVFSQLAKDGELNPSLSRDGVHLNAQGYGRWAGFLRPYVAPPE